MKHDENDENPMREQRRQVLARMETHAETCACSDCAEYHALTNSLEAPAWDNSGPGRGS